jgi:hypothetical protein
MGSICPPRPISSAVVPRGIYCPTITFFKNDSAQDLDLEAQAKHAKFLIQSGVHGITVLGTTGEAPLLTHEERNAVTKTVFSVREQMNTRTALVVGCSAQSVRETLQMCKDAAANGGEFALVLPPSYWAAASTPAVIENFYTMVCSKYSTLFHLSLFLTSQGCKRIAYTRDNIFFPGRHPRCEYELRSSFWTGSTSSKSVRY